LRIEEAVSAVRESAGWIVLDRLSLIRVTGPHRAKLLHNLLSNDIANLAEGQGRLAALMNLKGQQVAWMRIACEADALICELPTAVRDTVVETFLHYKVGAPVRFEKVEAGVFGVFGPLAAKALADCGITSLPAAPDTFSASRFQEGVVRVNRGSDLPADGLMLHVDAQRANALEEKLRVLLGEAMAGATLDTLRIEEGLPWHGIDVTEENLLHETGRLSVYHSPAKGCYLGQEVVARLEGRGGNVNKRLRGLRCAAAIPAGADILGADPADPKTVGRVTSAGISPRFGPIAMGYLHRSHGEPGTKVVVGGVAGEVAELPFSL
jgi:tRNA-modifying protein YgfZ